MLWSAVQLKNHFDGWREFGLLHRVGVALGS